MPPQQTDGTTYSFSYVYNLDGTLQSVTYPSTRKLAYQYDAAGRLTAIGENTVGATDYASAIGYKPHGGINSLTLGNGLHESWAYNQRLQPTAIKLGTTSGGSDKLKLDFNYGTTNNNGNVRSQTITRPSLTALTQTYTYDGANRLKTAAESGAGAAWSRTYGYDVYGNRAVTANSGLPTSPLMPTATTNFSTSTNRLTLTGARYDNAGNLTATSLGDTLKYDAENRLKSYTYRNATTNYKYGPEGRRVQKATPALTETYVYDAFGKLAAEYSTAAPSNGGTFYRTPDHLGSTRLVTKQDKSDADCYDYAPFGEEIPNTLGNRSSNACFAASFDGRHRFTGKERDDESDLDYFLARYYSGPLGRFLNPDQPFADQYPENPQSWNLYGYVRNNPLTFVDPDGRTCVVHEDSREEYIQDGGQTCEEASKPQKDVTEAEDPGFLATFLAPHVPRYVKDDVSLSDFGAQVVAEVHLQTAFLRIVCPGTAGVAAFYTPVPIPGSRNNVKLGGGVIVTGTRTDIAFSLSGSGSAAGGRAGAAVGANTSEFSSAFEGTLFPFMFPIGGSGVTAGPVLSKSPGGVGGGVAVGYGNFSVGIFGQQSLIQRGPFGPCPEQEQ